jgi:hypothetical protein
VARRVDLCPPVVDVCGYAGDTMSLRIVLAEPGSLPGATWTAQVRRRRSDEVIATFTVTMESEDAAILTLDPATTADLAGLVGSWDVQAAVNGSVRTLVQGEMVVNPDVTRPGVG